MAYRNVTLRELAILIPEFEWQKYMTGIFEDIPDVNVTDDEIIVIDDFKYLIDASKLYANLVKYYQK